MDDFIEGLMIGLLLVLVALGVSHLLVGGIL